VLRGGIIHGRLAAVLAGLRHTDGLVIADSGLPVPVGGPEVVDLAVVYGVPPFGVVLEAVLDAIVVEAVTVARELPSANPACWEHLGRVVDAPVDQVGHDAFKELVGGARAVVRTGEATPYANVLVRCGVPF
jgi:D-ribose pyranase